MTDEQRIDLNLDLGKFTVKDMRDLAKYQAGLLPLLDLTPTLERVIDGGVGHLPVTSLPVVAELLIDTVQIALSERGQQLKRFLYLSPTTRRKDNNVQ